MEPKITISKSESMNLCVPYHGARRTTITATANTHATCDPAIYPPARAALEGELTALGLDPAAVSIEQIRGGYKATIETPRQV